jgi:hypothetical protein
MGSFPKRPSVRATLEGFIAHAEELEGLPALDQRRAVFTPGSRDSRFGNGGGSCFRRLGNAWSGGGDGPSATATISGSWARGKDKSNLGLGLPIMAQLCSPVSVQPSEVETVAQSPRVKWLWLPRCCKDPFLGFSARRSEVRRLSFSMRKLFCIPDPLPLACSFAEVVAMDG